MITFNVVFTPGSVQRLLPFARSLLQVTGVRIRTVANGCGVEEIRLLASAAHADDRIFSHVLPSPNPVEHGLALNHLFEAFPEPYFAMVDSDVIASGEFMKDLLPMRPGQAAVFAAAPVWVTEDEAVASPGCRLLSGRHRVLHDGTPVGGTYLAIYDRSAIEPVWRAAPRGFAVHNRYTLPRSTKSALAARGWDYPVLDTARLINLQLLLDGFTLENRFVPELHHVGGLSSEEFRGLRPMLRALPQVLRSRDGRRIVDAGMREFNRLRGRGDPTYRRMSERRHIVLSHIGAVLDALAAGGPVPPAPPMDSAVVEQRVMALVSALEAHYRPNLYRASPA